MFQPIFRPNRTAVVGAIAVGVAIATSSFSIVRAEHANPAGSVSYTCGSGKACVEGDSTGSTTGGVSGTAAKSDGVHGLTDATNGSAGVTGVSKSGLGSGYGVYGKSSNGQGVYGISSSGNGVEGHTTGAAAAVAGYALNTATGGEGVIAESNNSADAGVAIYAQGDNSTSELFSSFNKATGGSCVIDQNANLTCTGTIMGSVERSQHRNSNGQKVLAYGSESTSATLEDFGTARMSGGVANIWFDPAFASTIDRNRPYYVFLTPLGETRGLYVSIKTSNGFQVRETEGGRSRVSFDYRIVARPLDAKNDRLPLAPTVRMVR
jgi:hypothetical protein